MLFKWVWAQNPDDSYDSRVASTHIIIHFCICHFFFLPDFPNPNWKTRACVTPDPFQRNPFFFFLSRCLAFQVPSLSSRLLSNIGTYRMLSAPTS